MKKFSLVLFFSIMAVAAFAQTTTGGTPFDPTTGVTTFKNELGSTLNSIFPIAISIMLIPLGYKLVMRFIRRGMKV